MSAEIVKAALRGFEMEPADLEAKLATCSPTLRDKLEAEMSAVTWVLGPCLIWNELGVLDDVLAYLKGRCDEQTEAQVPAGV